MEGGEEKGMEGKEVMKREKGGGEEKEKSRKKRAREGEEGEVGRARGEGSRRGAGAEKEGAEGVEGWVGERWRGWADPAGAGVWGGRRVWNFPRVTTTGQAGSREGSRFWRLRPGPPFQTNSWFIIRAGRLPSSSAMRGVMRCCMP